MVETSKPTIVDPTEKHPFYVVEGEDYVRVTSVINDVMGGPKSGMAFWGAKLMADYMEAMLSNTEYDAPSEEYYEDMLKTQFNPNAVKKAAGERGQQAHDLFEALVLGNLAVDKSGDKLWVVSPDGINFVPTSYDLGVCKAYIEVAQGIDGLLPEQRVYSKSYRFAGKSDLIGGSVVCDVKTHNPPAYYTDFVQMGAYSQAWWEMTGQVIDTHIAILPHEDGTYTPYYSYVSPKVFLDCLSIYREMQKWEVESG